MTDHDVIIALVAFDALVMVILILMAIPLAVFGARIKAADEAVRRARHARPKDDAQ